MIRLLVLLTLALLAGQAAGEPSMHLIRLVSTTAAYNANAVDFVMADSVYYDEVVALVVQKPDFVDVTLTEDDLAVVATRDSIRVFVKSSAAASYGVLRVEGFAHNKVILSALTEPIWMVSGNSATDICAFYYGGGRRFKYRDGSGISGCCFALWGIEP